MTIKTEMLKQFSGIYLDNVYRRQIHTPLQCGSTRMSLLSTEDSMSSVYAMLHVEVSMNAICSIQKIAMKNK